MRCHVINQSRSACEDGGSNENNKVYWSLACEPQTHFRSSLLYLRRERSDDRKCGCGSQANWSPKQYHFSRSTYPGCFLWITLRRSFIPWRRLTFPGVIQTENNINNLKILLPSISQHLNNFFWTICHQNQLSSAITWYYVVLIFESVDEILWCDHSNETSSISSTFTWYHYLSV